MPLVSVVIATRNRSDLLRRTLRSICAQEGVDLEVIVVDDASSDGTTTTMARSADDRVKVIRLPQREGVARARNCGIAAARGQWVAFCDDDDLWAPDKLAAQLSAAEQSQAGWVYAGDVNVDEGLRVLSGCAPPDPSEVMRTLRRRNPLSSGGSSVMVRAQVLEDTGAFDCRLCRTEDWDLWLRLASTGPPAWVCRPLVAYTFHRFNIVQDLESVVTEPLVIARRYNLVIDRAAVYRRAAWLAMRGGRRLLAVKHYGNAVACGDVRSVGRAAVALVLPHVGTHRLFGLLKRDAEWTEQAERWLSAFAASTAVRDQVNV
jgi:glycosyltransferase involved in cell wall biosynthesis